MLNRFKTAALLASLTALLLWGGQALGGTMGLWLALGLAAALNIGSYWFSDRIVLRMHSAQELTPESAPELHGMTARLAGRAGLPMPRLYLIPEEAPNAFATGRNPKHGVVAVTAGLLRALERDEVAAVIAHELGHIRNRDTLIMSVAATIGGALGMLANLAAFGFGGGHSDEEGESANPLAGLLGVILAPIAATLIQASISRTREFLADEAAARFTGDPEAMIRALAKIDEWSRAVPMHNGSPAMAHLYIANPFSTEGLAQLFSTHPPTEERIARLFAMVPPRARAAWTVA